MYKHLAICLLALCASIGTAFAQERTARGIVYDATDGEPLMGVSVKSAKNSQLGVATDIDGNFSITLPEGSDSLVFSYIGKETVRLKIKDGLMKIYLEDDSKVMEEVVVLGYGSARKLGSITGSVGKVGSAQLEKMPTANFTDALQGQVAGLSVLNSSGEPAASAVIRLRGVNTIFAGSEPLFILDGAPINSDVFNALNPTDIENITVLKDAASTAIYGSRAANGVIVITSKKGKMEQRPQVKISAQYSFANIINSGIQMMGSQDYMAFREMLDPSLATNGEWLTHKNVVSKNGISTDWMKEIYRDNAPSLQLNASVMGGSTNTNYYLSVNHMARNGIEPLSGFQRESLRFNEDIRIAPMLKVGVDANLSYNKSETNPEQNSGDLYLTNPTVFSRLARPDDAPYYYTVNPDYSINRFGRADYLHYTGTNSYNPWWMAEHRKRESRTVHLDGNIFEEVTPISGLRLKAVQALAAYDDNYTSISKPRDYYDSEMGDRVDAYGDGSSAYRTESSQRWYQFTSSNTAEYSFNLDSKHNFTVLLGQETIYSKDQGFAVSRSGLTDIRMLLLTNATEEPATTQDFSETVYNSFFGQVNYDYNGKYNASASVRRDGSSRFPSKDRWATFWSAGARWNIMSEDFMKPAKKWMDQLSAKISYGTTGNSSISDYMYYGLVSSSGVQYEGQSGTLISSQSISDLTWETVGQLNIGLEANLFNRLNVSLDYYNKKTSNMLLDIPYSYTTGFSSGIGNVGSMVNKGVELSLNLDILNRNDLRWSVYSNLNYNRNKITSLFNGTDEFVLTGTGQKLQVGKPYGEFYLVRRAGVDSRDGKQLWYDADGNLTKVYNQEANSVQTGKNRFAPWYGGFGTSFSWNGLTVGADLSWALGKYALNNDRLFYENAKWGMTYNQSVSMLNMWTKPGDVTDIPAATETIQMDDHLLENASFLRLKKVTIAYNLPKKVIKPMQFVSNINVFVTGRNLLTATKYTGYDPEPDTNVIQFNYPNTREFTFGAEVTF